MLLIDSQLNRFSGDGFFVNVQMGFTCVNKMAVDDRRLPFIQVLFPVGVMLADNPE